MCEKTHLKTYVSFLVVHLYTLLMFTFMVLFSDMRDLSYGVLLKHTLWCSAYGIVSGSHLIDWFCHMNVDA